MKIWSAIQFFQISNVIDARLSQKPPDLFVCAGTDAALGSTPENTRIRLSLADLVDLRTTVSNEASARTGCVAAAERFSARRFFAGRVPVGGFARPLTSGIWRL